MQFASTYQLYLGRLSVFKTTSILIGGLSIHPTRICEHDRIPLNPRVFIQRHRARLHSLKRVTRREDAQTRHIVPRTVELESVAIELFTGEGETVDAGIRHAVGTVIHRIRQRTTRVDESAHRAESVLNVPLPACAIIDRMDSAWAVDEVFGCR